MISLSETWLNRDNEKYRNIQGYAASFQNRVGRTGGGVDVYVRTMSVLSAERLSIGSPTDCESVFLQCCLPYSKVIIAQIYRLPNTSPALFCEQMSGILDFIDVSSNTVIITGDFNFDLHTISNDSEVQLFFNMMLPYSFLSLISLTTRQSKTRLSLLDNVYCNNIPLAGDPGIIYDCQIIFQSILPLKQ